jgi:hypothetical protein
MTDVLDLLLAADPAPATVGYPPTVIAANVAAIVGGPVEADPIRTSHRGRHVVYASAAVAALAVLATSFSVIDWPGSDGATASAAYAITKKSDGSVGVVVRWNELKDPASLQADLRAAGVPAAVIVESAPGGCSVRPPRTIDVGIGLLTNERPTSGQAFTINPRVLPAATTIVLDVPASAGPSGSAGIQFVALYATDQPAPACLASKSQGSAPTVPR